MWHLGLQGSTRGWWRNRTNWNSGSYHRLFPPCDTKCVHITVISQLYTLLRIWEFLNFMFLEPRLLTVILFFIFVCLFFRFRGRVTMFELVWSWGHRYLSIVSNFLYFCGGWIGKTEGRFKLWLNVIWFQRMKRRRHVLGRIVCRNTDSCVLANCLFTIFALLDKRFNFSINSYENITSEY